MEYFSNDQINKKIDIELKKKELEKKYEATFFINDSNISPELEDEWVNHIEQFEQQFEKKDTISVWEYLGKPAFIKADEIAPEKIADALNRLLEFMSENQIELDTLCPVDDKVLYQFITDELFFCEIDNIRIKDMNTCFIYEEFHPNAEYDIRSAYEYFFKCIMSKMKNIGGEGYDLLNIDTDNYKNSEGIVLDKNEVIKKINTLLDSFDYFEFITNEIKDITINPDITDAKLNFEIEYKGRFKNSLEYIVFDGKGHFRLKPSEYGGWDIYNINMPGFII
jgi:hypothetical protein